MIRTTTVAGSFYPSEKEEIIRYIDRFNSVLRQHAIVIDAMPKAVIVPHAGYIYSGFSANVAYRALADTARKRFAVIGPSHRVAFSGISMCNFSAYDTPLGALQGDKELFELLHAEYALTCKDVHFEHSTETQFPFLKHYIPDAAIIELIYGDADATELSKIIDTLLAEDIGIIISTDLSHFYDQEHASMLDSICIEAIRSLDNAKLHNGCEACGKIGVDAMLQSAKRADLRPTVLDYRTSADASGDTSSVVGYLSAAFS